MQAINCNHRRPRRRWCKDRKSARARAIVGPFQGSVHITRLIAPNLTAFHPQLFAASANWVVWCKATRFAVAAANLGALSSADEMRSVEMRWDAVRWDEWCERALRSRPTEIDHSACAITWSRYRCLITFPALLQLWCELCMPLAAVRPSVRLSVRCP